MLKNFRKRLDSLERSFSVRKRVVVLQCKYGDSETTQEALKQQHIALHPEDANAEQYVWILSFDDGKPILERSAIPHKFP